MRNPSRTLQNSIFEPLYSHQEELHFQPKPIHSDWLPQSLISPSSSVPPSNKASMRRAAATIFISADEDSSSEKVNVDTRRPLRHESITNCDHAILGMHSPFGTSSIVPTSAATPYCGPPSRSRSSSDVVDDHDDGSVASKLLTCITKSISSPSLLACCKESVRETPYQKTLRLRKMKLQHCAEELGSESSDGSLCDGDYNTIFDSLNSRMSYQLESSSQSTSGFSKAHTKSEGNASSTMISVRSSPNLGCPSLLSKQTSQNIKERSFPPPLTHTLKPRSPSSDSFSYSLRAYREDGRFVLKEVKVPCRQYFHANRKDGRLTLQCLITDEDFESQHSNEAHKECKDLQVEDVNVGVLYRAAADVALEKAKGGSCDKIEVESANTANLVGELEVCRGKLESDHVGMDNTDERSNVEKVGCLNGKSLPMAICNCGSSKPDKVNLISHVCASSRIKSDFKAAKRVTGKASRMRLSSQHLSSSSWKQQSPIYLPGKSPKLKLGHDFDVPKLSQSQCAENLSLESKSTRGVSIGGGKILQGFEITPSASLRKSGYGVGKSPSSTIIFKDVSAKCLMENVTKLVASFGVHGGKWSCGEEIKSRELDNKSYSSEGVKESSMYNGIKSINVGVRERENDKSISGVSFDVKCECSFRYGAFKEGDCGDVGRSCLPSSSFHFDLQIPTSMNNQNALKGKEWLHTHTLHCKEIFDRNQLAKGFMKLHCVA